MAAASAVLVITALHAGLWGRLGTHLLTHPLGDLLAQHFPVLTWAQRNLAEGWLPLWNPHIFCGYPQWAEGQLMLLGIQTPLLPLPVTVALNLWWVLLQVLTALLAAWWLRSFHLTPLTAILGGLSITLSGAVVFRIPAGHINIVACLPWFFLMAGAWNRWWERGRTRLLAVALLGWGLMLLAGHIQTAHELIVWWGLLTLFSQGIWGWRALRRWVLGMVSVAIPGSLLAAVLLLPQMEFASVSPRQDFDIFSASSFSFPLENLVTALFPGCFGHGLTTPLQGQPSDYLGRWRFFWEVTLLLNPLILGCLLLPRSRRHRRTALGLWIASGVALLLALGRQTPLFALALHVIPGLDLFRGPGKFMAMAIIGITAIACIRFDRFLRRDPGKDRRITRRQALTIAGVILCPLGFLMIHLAATQPTSLPGRVFAWAAELPSHGQIFERFPATPSDSPLSGIEAPRASEMRTETFEGAVALALSIWAVLLIFSLAVARARSGRVLFAAILVGTSVGHAMWRASPYLTHVEVSNFGYTPAVADTLRSLAREGRVLWLGRHHRNLGALHGISTVNGYYSLLGRRQNSLFQAAFNHSTDFMENDSIVQSLGPMVRWLGVHAYATHDPEIILQQDGGEIIRLGNRTILRVSQPTPLAWVMTGGVAVPNETLAAERLRGPLQITGEEVLLETAQSLPQQDVQFFEVPLIRPSPGEITVDLSEAPGGWAVVLESLVPGWRAWVDDQSTPIIPAQVAFMAVEVAGNSHTLHLAYRPASFRLGLFLTLAMGGVLLTLFLRRR
ncbi:YfhO family protein [Candidatus Sumerlaeota bacterium]|nr:YfhO family protein [Candidatus Sumerlaeota bacterium]